MPGVKREDKRLKSFERVVSVLYAQSPLYFHEIRDRLGMTSSVATGALKTAKMKGLIEVVKRGNYTITDTGKEHIKSRTTKEA